MLGKEMPRGRVAMMRGCWVGRERGGTRRGSGESSRLYRAGRVDGTGERSTCERPEKESSWRNTVRVRQPEYEHIRSLSLCRADRINSSALTPSSPSVTVVHRFLPLPVLPGSAPEARTTPEQAPSQPRPPLPPLIWCSGPATAPEAKGGSEEEAGLLVLGRGWEDAA